MSTVYCSQLNSGLATAVGGLAGGPNLARSTEDSGPVRVKHATFTVPSGSGAGSQIGDIIVLANLGVFSRFYYAIVYNGAMGSSATISIGKIDPNNSTNTDSAHYVALTSVTSAGNFLCALNAGEQVGADPAGDQSTGNVPPAYGSQDVQITATVAGAALTAAAILNVIIFYSDGGGR